MPLFLLSKSNSLRWVSVWYLDAGSADIISFAATIFLTERLSPLAHFVVAPSKTEALRFGFVFFKGTRRFYIVTCTEQINPNRISTVGDGFGLFAYFKKILKDQLQKRSSHPLLGSAMVTIKSEMDFEIKKPGSLPAFLYCQAPLSIAIFQQGYKVSFQLRP